MVINSKHKDFKIIKDEQGQFQVKKLDITKDKEVKIFS